MSPSARNPLHSRLRAATAQAHHGLERDLDWEARTQTRVGYSGLLASLHGFHAAYEPAIAEGLGEEGLLQGRRRLALLEADLRALGLDSCALASLPRHPPVLLASPAAALGALYVLEGSSLGGLVIARGIERRLGDAVGQACAYYRGYGRETAARWAAFLDALQARAADPATQGALCEAAGATFAALRTWLMSEVTAPAGSPDRAPPASARPGARAGRAPRPAPA